MPQGPTGAKLCVALTPSTRRALGVSPAPASAAAALIQPWLHFSQDDPAPTLYLLAQLLLTAPGIRPKGRFHRGHNRPWGQPHHQSSVLLVPAFTSLGVSIWEEGKQAALHLPRVPDSHQLGETQQEEERDVVRNVWGDCGRGGQDDLTTLPWFLSLRSGGRKSGSKRRAEDRGEDRCLGQSWSGGR